MVPGMTCTAALQLLGSSARLMLTGDREHLRHACCPSTTVGQQSKC